MKAGGKKRGPLPIDDVSYFEAIMERVEKLAACLPDCQAELVHLLGLLIADALSELTGPKFDWPRQAGDLDDANGIHHLLNDYPASVPPGKFWKESFLHVEEEAAAQWLVKLYLARDFVEMGFGLPPETTKEIELCGLKLVALRLHGPAYLRDLERRKTSKRNRGIARNPRNQTTKQDLEKFRLEFIEKQEKDGVINPERGWRKAACLHFGIDMGTIRKRMAE